MGFRVSGARKPQSGPRDLVLGVSEGTRLSGKEGVLVFQSLRLRVLGFGVFECLYT